MDLKNLSEDELKKLEKEIAEHKQLLKENKLKEKQKEVEIHLKKLREQEDVLLELIEHGRTSCSDTEVCNGWGSASYGARCNKCHLIEILNGEWGNRFDVKITVDIYDTEI